MTIQQLSRTIVDTVLTSLDRHTFAGIPETEIREAVNAVARLIREESQAVVEPDDDEEP